MASLTRIARAVGVAAVLSAALPPAAIGSVEEESKLAGAQANLEDASVRVAELENRKAEARKRVTAAKRQAERLGAVADEAEARAEDLADALGARRTAAAEEVREAGAEHRQEVDDWRTQRGWALAGAMFLLLLALASALWPALLRWPAVTWLLARPLGLRISAMLLPILVGLGMLGSSSTAVALAGGALLGASVAAGLLLLLIARIRRREATGERPSGQSVEASRRGRLGGGVLGGVAAVTLLVLAVVLEKPAAPTIPEETLALAGAGDPLDNPTPELEDRQEAAGSARGRADSTQNHLDDAARALRSVDGRLGDARLVIRQAQRRVERWEDALAEPDPLPPPDSNEDGFGDDEIDPQPESGCDPNYSGCVPPYPPDVDCADVDGPVDVSGSDPHGLDADGDGVGCE